jgi:hypothetical protein
LKDSSSALSELIHSVAFRINPRLATFYIAHEQFLNDAIVELTCLMIANLFIIVFSYYFIGLALSIVLTLTATPLTFGLKYLLHKHWVWKNENKHHSSMPK